MLPRSFFKSYAATIGYPIWLLIQEPDGMGMRGAEERILIANATATNSEHFLDKIKSVFERNDLFKWLFPELIPDFTSRDVTWNTTEATIVRKTDYPEPTLSAAGVGAAIVSRHFTRIILDDLINEQHAESPELMRKAILWYKYAESLLEVSGRDELTVIGTRWAFNDLYSDIEETEGDWSPTNPLGFKKYIRSAIENDQPIFPERFPFTELSRLRVKLGEYMFSCLYLNNPRQPGVNDFNVEWLQYYRFTDKAKIQRNDGKIIDPADLDRVAIVDIATSVRKDADFSAVVIVGVDEFRKVYLLEAWHGRVQTRNLIEQIFKLAGRWHVRALHYEDSATQKLIQYSLEEYRKETGQYIPIIGIKVGNQQTKEQRIRLVSQYFQQKAVYIRESMGDFKKEYQDFPLGRHDDILDAFANFPRCVRFQYPEGHDEQRTEEQQQDEFEDSQSRAELDIFMRGRSPVTGY